MSRQLTVQGRFVQGGLTLHPEKDMKTGQPKKDANGNVVQGVFLGLAVPKMIQQNGQWVENPEVARAYAEYDAEARACFPHLFPNGGACTHPRFAMKWQDGDGVDSNGKSVADQPGFAGHWILKLASRYAPTCYVRDSHGNLQQLAEPEKVIKKGHYIAVGITIDGNGVEPGNNQAVPGLFASPNLVLYVAPGEEIVSGPDPNAAFAGIAGVQAPVGAATAGGLQSPPMPNGGAAPRPAGPPMPASAPAAPAGGPPMPAAAPARPAGPPLPGGARSGPPMPPQPAGPVYIMQPSAEGASREELHALGWTDDGLVAAGHMVIQ